ncbi:rRNA maturation RNase YbeY [Rickettsiales endosymbiont of Peranema trichophorum]|uniref:rRNA maturation RNase YbeY n=1 Tax=Rickettsiales endosymbiont of Peranema trichophorum TaxID=2486577 RepID=UPI001023755B|nr:rRNA maturation RNase YbeY [Rickettsiales endosymbiont of Peranema trichophorum]RZI47594.1 rRNA maturation RNase YbeY [Rickettsiales endosymbiont of Peranema trichophorum]
MKELIDLPKDGITVDVVFDSPLWTQQSLANPSFKPLNTRAFITRVICDTLGYVGLPMHCGQRLELVVLLSDLSKMHALNMKYRGEDKPTNVLSFPNYDCTKGNYRTILKDEIDVYLGDIALSYTTVLEESIIQEKRFQDHLAHLTVHGILHLLGYDHNLAEDEAVMQELEVNLLGGMGIANPYVMERKEVL